MPMSWVCVHLSHATFPPKDELRPKTMKLKVLLNHRDYGGKTHFSGKAVTISCYETNQILREVSNPYPGTRSKVEGSYVQHQQYPQDTLALMMRDIPQGVSLPQR